jgi:hypothetical protein
MATYKQPQTAPVAAAGKRTAKPMKNPSWTPMDGVGITPPAAGNSTGAKTRGNGAAERGITARGPMA